MAIVAFAIVRGRRTSPPEVQAEPITPADPEVTDLTELDPSQRKFCPGCAAPLHLSAPACPHCGAPQAVSAGIIHPAGRKPFPHIWHIVGTVLTGGLWLIPYILIWGFRDRQRYL